MATRPLEPVYLITGSDLPKVALALHRLRVRFAESAVEQLFAESAPGSDAVGSLNALGLFGGEKLVLVEGIERWKKADTEAIVEYLQAPTPGATVALVGDASKLAGLEDACALSGSVLRFDVPLGRRNRLDYPAWVRAQFERLSVRADHDTADRLVELVGEDTFALQNEIEKLAAWAGGETVGVRDVEGLAVPTSETSNFALVDAWGARDVGAALAACEKIRLRGDEPFLIAARLSDYVGKVRRVHGLVEQDIGVREIASRLGMKEYPARKQAGQASNFSRDELEDAVMRLAGLDLALKGGSRLDADLELERAIVDITRRGAD